MTKTGTALLEVQSIQGKLLYRSPVYHLMTGNQTVEWDGIDANGRYLSTGLYLYNLLIGDHQYSGKLLILR